MRRRELFLRTALLTAAACMPPARGASLPRIGMLSGGDVQGGANWDAFYATMKELGYEEGRSVIYDRRTAQGEPERLPELARDLVAAAPRLIVTTGASEALSAHRATRVIPIVMIFGTDPVVTGLARSLARPGGNVTGLTRSIPGFDAKRLQLLAEAVPTARRIGVLENPAALRFAPYRQEIERAAAHLGLTLLPAATARRPQELQAAFAQLERQRPHALLVHSDVVFFVGRKQVIQFAGLARLPAMYNFDVEVQDGGLMAFAVEFRDLYERAPVFVDRILKGADPADMPIEQPTRFGLRLNLKTARAMGLSFPQPVLLRAEHIIE